MHTPFAAKLAVLTPGRYAVRGVSTIKRNFVLELSILTFLVLAIDLLWQPVLGVLFGLSVVAGVVLAARHGAASQAAANKLAVTLLLGGGLGLLITVVSGALALAVSSERGRLLQIVGSLFVEPWEQNWRVGLGRLLWLIGFLALVGLVWAIAARQARPRERSGDKT